MAVTVAASAQINTDQVMRIGRNALYFEDYILSIQYFNQVIKAKPWLAEPYFYRAVAKFYLEDYRGAEADATEAIKRNQFITDAYQIRGIARQTLHEDSAAVADYDIGLTMLPEEKTFLLNKAVAEQTLERYDASAATYARLLEIYPSYDRAFLGRAQLQLARGDTIAALADVGRCIEHNKANADAYVLRSDIRVRHLNEYDSALLDMDEAIKLQPREAGYFINRAYIKYKLDDYFGSMADYDYALQLDPQNLTAHLNRGLLRYEVQDDDKAIEDFSFVIAHDPKNMMARFNRAELYTRTGQYRKSIPDYDALLEVVDDMPGLYYARSEAKRRSGDTRGGMADYDQAKRMIAQIRRNPGRYSNIDATTTPEQLAASEETADDVKAKFQTLLTVDTDNPVKPQYENRERGRVQDNRFAIDPEPMFALTYDSDAARLGASSHFTAELTDINESHQLPATLYLSVHPLQQDEQSIGRRFASIDYFTAAISTNPGRAIDHFARAIDYITVKDYDAAIADLNAAISLSPKFALAYFARANARYSRLQSRKADIADDGSATTPEAKAAAMMLQQDERNEIALINADFNTTLALSPRMLYAYYNKGCLLLAMGDLTEAISAFTKALELRPDLGEAYYNRGLTYLRLGNREPGIADLSRAGEYGITPSYSVLKRMAR